MVNSQACAHFGLPLADGVRVRRLSYGLWVTADPMYQAPGEPNRRARVGIAEASESVLGSDGVADQKNPKRLGPWAGGFCRYDLYTYILTSGRKIAEVSEEEGACGAGAVTRSIKYMMGHAGKGNVSDEPQKIYQELLDDIKRIQAEMDANSEGEGDGSEGEGSAGYSPEAIRDASRNFAQKHGKNGVPLYRSELTTWEYVMGVIQVLGQGADVEVFIQNPETGYGHVVMVASMGRMQDGRFGIGFIEDPDQTDGIAENQQSTIILDAEGFIVSGELAGAQAVGFLVEMPN
jgi:hypothetical protein